MDDISDRYLREFVTAAHQTVQHRLVLCASGNLSWRVDKKRMLITAARTWMAEMCEDQVAICRIDDGKSLNGKEPSIEIGFHSAVLRERRDVDVVLHFQSPCATALACCAEQERNFFVTPEIPCYIGPVAVVPYLDPGSRELAEAVSSAMKEHNLTILRNHGQVTVGKDFCEAIQRAVFFDFACRILLRAGDQVQALSDEAVACTGEGYLTFTGRVE